MMQPRSKILAVDDDVIDITIVKKLLAKDYDLRTASTGEQALEIAADFLPDIILLDVMMPGITGYETCRRIRANTGLGHTKIIMVSGQDTVSERLQGYEAGADDYITKPFDEGELLAKIRVYLRLKSVEEMDQFKTNVLTLLSHEARTPLNSLLAPAEMLMSDEKISAEEQKLLIELMCGAAKRLHRFFENAMLLSSLKSGKREFNPVPTNFCDIVHEAICEVAIKAAERKIKIEEEFNTSPTICLDQQEIKRVLTAILDNAVRFSPTGGSVTACIFDDDGDVCLSVTDQGEGIDLNYLPYVFDELSDPDVDHHSQGQGLNLAIARQVILLHGGTISAESTKGSGATFMVRLPVMVPSELAHCAK